ncbi:xanthine dehydrogenase [Siculibacillus lacustris]|uniref:Xanthine dehydrogenase n=1 Tax=Siculibacillus lacustris TaxID=1549641 RepID=A0A4Q9VRG6_9HYPH|nr:xanthine dehydrogenase [Siculibacillus lacustris]TBW38474.1 xanthine dehydrogenase [Siculibacillus lacustris]
MLGSDLATFLSGRGRPFAVVLGTNEIASAIAVHLTRAGDGVALVHDPHPPVLRRAMAFDDALYGDPATVEGITGLRCETTLEVVAALAEPHRVAPTLLDLSHLLALRSPAVLVDARLQKDRTAPDLRGLAAIAIGVGPNFAVGVNCDVAIETHPEVVGRVLFGGATRRADGCSPLLGAVGGDRLLRAPQAGRWHTPHDIGQRIYRGQVVGRVDGEAIVAPFDGILRGVVRDATEVTIRAKLVEIDPRGRAARWTGIDERGRAIASAVVAAAARASADRRSPVGLDQLH